MLFLRHANTRMQLLNTQLIYFSRSKKMPHRGHILQIVAILLCIGCTTGCNKQIDQQNIAVTPGSAAKTYNVALLGDKTRTKLFNEIASAFESTPNAIGDRLTAEIRDGDLTFRLVCSTSESVKEQAGVAWEADLALLAVDSTQGPLPVSREHIVVIEANASSHIYDRIHKLRPDRRYRTSGARGTGDARTAQPLWIFR